MKTATINSSTLYLCDCMDLRKRSRFGGHFDRFKIRAGGNCKLASGGNAFAKFGAGAEHWDHPPPPEYFTELFRVAKFHIIWGGNYYDLPPSRNFVVWNKKVPDGMSFAQCELAWTDIVGNAKIFEGAWTGGWKCEDVDKIHPTQKPAKLYKWLLHKYAKPGDKILDTHMDSGSIAIACNELGFNLTASEIDEDYFEAACKRIKAAAAQMLLDF